MRRKEYEKALRALQVELCVLQEWVKEHGLRVVVYAKKLLELDPQDPEARQIYDQLTGKRAAGAGR